MRLNNGNLLQAMLGLELTLSSGCITGKESVDLLQLAHETIDEVTKLLESSDCVIRDQGIACENRDEAGKFKFSTVFREEGDNKETIFFKSNKMEKVKAKTIRLHIFNSGECSVREGEGDNLNVFYKISSAECNDLREAAMTLLNNTKKNSSER